ncbi:MAG: hypothetical protein PVJ19_06740, partial [Desulfobacteraceae bacterium]
GGAISALTLGPLGFFNLCANSPDSALEMACSSEDYGGAISAFHEKACQGKMKIGYIRVSKAAGLQK